MTLPLPEGHVGGIYRMQPFESGVFRSTLSLQDVSVFLCVSIVHSFLLANSIPKFIHSLVG